MKLHEPRPHTLLQRADAGGHSYDLVQIHKHPREIETEAQAFAKLMHLPEYARVELGHGFVATPRAKPLALDSVAALVEALQALRKVHLSGVIHADLKEDHVLVQVDTGLVFFIDFAYAVFDPGAKSAGLSCFYASHANLTQRVVCPMDDYEALVMAALSWLDSNKLFPPQYLFPVHPDGGDGLSRWAKWKRAFEAFVLTRLRSEAQASQDENEDQNEGESSEADRLVLACYRALVLLWDFPNKKWLSDQEHDDILRVLQQ
jgi:hypothetical protein